MKLRIINITILLLTVVSTLVAISFMPDIVPVHFDIHGAADRWGSKYEMLIVPGAAFLMLALGEINIKALAKKAQNASDEKEKTDAFSNIKVMNIVFTVINVMVLFLNLFVIYNSYSQLEPTQTIEFDLLKIVTIIMGISFVIMGNYMPRSRKNSMIGLRCGWSMYNDLTWQKSNRIGGYAIVVAGVVTVLGGLIFSGTVSAVIMMLSIIVTIVISLAYACVVYKQEKSKE